MLTEKERTRLQNKKEKPQIRAINNLRVKKRFAKWLNDLTDIALVLENLPDKQLDKEFKKLTDQHAYKFLEIAEKIMISRGFGPIEGDISKPEEWKVVIDENNQRPVEDIDIVRSISIKGYIHGLTRFDSSLINEVEMLEKLDKSPRFHDRVTEDERKGIRRVELAWDNFVKELTKKEPE